MNHFSVAHFNSTESATLPIEADVRDGVIYGPANSLTGTAVAFADDLSSLDALNPSDFETSERTALDSFYERSGVEADYIANEQTTRVVVLLEDERQLLVNDGETRQRIAVRRVMIRRYNGVANPQVGNVLVLKSSDGTRRYKLTEDPVESDGHLEWELEFSRSVSRSRGGNDVLPVG